MANFCTWCGTALEKEARFCTQCGKEISEHGSAESVRPAAFSDKRQKVLEGDKNSRDKNIIYIGLALFALLGFMLFLDSLPSMVNPVVERQPVISEPFDYPATPVRMRSAPVETRDGKIIFKLADLKKNKFLRFDYSSGTSTLPLLAYISEEGKVITAVSVCEPCNSTSFHIKGEQLVCNSCGTTWEVNSLNGVSGSCQKFPPDAVPSVVVGDEVHIDEQAVASWRRRI